MTPDDAAVIQRVGHDVVVGFVSVLNETIWLTIYTILVIKAATLLLNKKRRYFKVSVITLCAILTMYSIAIVLWSLDFTNFIVEARIMLIEAEPNVDLAERLAAADAFVLRLAATIDALYGYLSVIGDAIIIYRIFMLWGHSNHRWVLIAPCALLVGSFVATLLLTYCVGHLGSAIVLGAFETPQFCRNVQTATYSMAAATTLIATVLIGILTWNYRRSLRPLKAGDDDEGPVVHKRRRSQAENILFLLVESGLLYFLFFAIQVTGTIPPVQNWLRSHSGLTFAENMFLWCSSVIVGIYPTAIVVLSHSKYSVLDTAAATELTTFRFAAGPHQPIVDYDRIYDR
ncbi:hypothetical protein C8J56DRAFT_1019670 [Mycena floridula]|nr:hypothetical protein C8J56DRAFT_1019670 [Mycena floridula]